MPHRATIEELIARTQDPVQQATLLVLSKFDQSIEANTRATEAIAKGLDEHRSLFARDREAELHFKKEVRDHMLMDNRMLVSIRAGWWVGLMFLSLVNILGGFIITRAINSNDEQDRQIRMLQIEFAKMQADMARTHPVVPPSELFVLPK